jgi:hypothetical protein
MPPFRNMPKRGGHSPCGEAAFFAALARWVRTMQWSHDHAERAAIA